MFPRVNNSRSEYFTSATGICLWTVFRYFTGAIPVLEFRIEFKVSSKFFPIDEIMPIPVIKTRGDISGY
jgi:hypothetical protein